LAQNSKTHDSRCAIKVAGRKTAMTQFDNILTMTAEAAIKDHNAPIARQIVAIGAIFLLIVIGLH
jgi:hypothetical protein